MVNDKEKTGRIMSGRTFRVLTVGAVLLLSCGGGGEKSVPESELVRARDALKPLKHELARALKGAMKDGGPEEAIGVCRLEAPAITAALITEEIAIGRTSDRLRNPENAPEQWMEGLLSEYEAGSRGMNGRAVYLEDGSIGYVEPIYMKPLCLTCHGKEIAPSLISLLNELYPEDSATGYETSDFRGLFWVKLNAGGI